MATATVYLEHLGPACEFTHLFQIFSKFGSVSSVRVLRDAKKGVSRGIGYANFESADQAAVACAALNGATDIPVVCQPQLDGGEPLLARIVDDTSALRHPATDDLVFSVHYVPLHVDQTAFMAILVPHGRVVACKLVPRDAVRGPVKGSAIEPADRTQKFRVALVEFSSAAEATKAACALHHSTIFGAQPMHVKPADGEARAGLVVTRDRVNPAATGRQRPPHQHHTATTTPPAAAVTATPFPFPMMPMAADPSTNPLLAAALSGMSTGSMSPPAGVGVRAMPQTPPQPQQAPSPFAAQQLHHHIAQHLTNMTEQQRLMTALTQMLVVQHAQQRQQQQQLQQLLATVPVAYRPDSGFGMPPAPGVVMTPQTDFLSAALLASATPTSVGPYVHDPTLSQMMPPAADTPSTGSYLSVASDRTTGSGTPVSTASYGAAPIHPSLWGPTIVAPPGPLMHQQLLYHTASHSN